MNLKKIFQPNLKKIIIAIILTIIFVIVNINIAQNHCNLIDCIQGFQGETNDYSKLSLFPHCCEEVSSIQLMNEYIFFYILPLFISYLLISIVLYFIKK